MPALKDDYADCQNAIWAEGIGCKEHLWEEFRSYGASVDLVIEIIRVACLGAREEARERPGNPRAEECLRRFPLALAEYDLPSFRRYIAGKLGMM